MGLCATCYPGPWYPDYKIFNKKIEEAVCDKCGAIYYTMKEQAMTKLVWSKAIGATIQADELYLVRRSGLPLMEPWTSKGRLIIDKLYNAGLRNDMSWAEIAGPIEVEEPEQPKSNEWSYDGERAELYVHLEERNSTIKELERCLKQSQQAFEAKQKLVDQYAYRIQVLEFQAKGRQEIVDQYSNRIRDLEVKNCSQADCIESQMARIKHWEDEVTGLSNLNCDQATKLLKLKELIHKLTNTLET